jgi:acetylornithine/N-succinyldiaminopimelate aminotransferase
MSMMNTINRIQDFVVSRAEGCVLYDDGGGKTMLDFYADTGTASLGYNSVYQKSALRQMLADGTPLHVPFVVQHDLREAIAEQLCNRTGMDKVFFCTSGAEATEAAIKCARKTQAGRGFPHRVNVYSVHDAFHGRTLGSLAASDGPTYHYAGFGPMPSGFHRFREIEDIKPDAAAVIIAPIFGNYDLRVLDVDWLARLMSYCDKHDIIVIFDEVQTGAARASNHWTYAQHIGLRPDIVCLAKGMAMGAACGAMLARGDAAMAFTPGSHYTTFGAQPLAMAMVRGMIAYLDETQSKQWENTMDKGKLLVDLLKQSEHIKALGMGQDIDVRGHGLMVGFDVAVDKMAFGVECQRLGLLLVGFRPGPGPVKLSPPLIVTKDEIKLAVRLMERAARNVLGDEG